MGTEIEWNERFNIGVPVVDKAHQRLFSIVRKLVNLNEEEDKQRWACEEGIKYFKSYTAKHFAEEEEYMRSIHYEGYEMHKRLHDDMRENTLPALEKDLVESDYSTEAMRHFLGICIGWLTGHILSEDYAITGKATNKWKHENSSEDIESLEEAVDVTMKRVFNQNTEVISEHYNGADFAKGVYYRATFRSKENGQLKVLLVFEEKKILEIVSKMLGIQLKKASKLMSDVAKQAFGQFIQGLCNHYEPMKAYQFEKDNVLTYSQFRQEFKSTRLYQSILMDTDDMGYFACCIQKR